MIKQKSPRELNIMREAGRIVARCHQRVNELIEPGITTGAIDDVIESLIRDHDATPAFKNYRGFPASICSSINEEIVHGIPSKDRTLTEGDIVSIDIGVQYKNYFGDAARTAPVGSISDEAKTLLQDCSLTLNRALEQVQPGILLSEICKFIQEFAEGKGYNVVRDYVGHGIGREMHEDPQIPNYYNPEHHQEHVTLKQGMVLAFEPMLNCGTYETEKLENDWTVVTQDGKLSAHFEDTVAITDDGIEIFTRLDNNGKTFHHSLEQ